jgi:hypothetical protein
MTSLDTQSSRDASRCHASVTVARLSFQSAWRTADLTMRVTSWVLAVTEERESADV